MATQFLKDGRLAGTAALNEDGDLAARMVEGIDRFASGLTRASVAGRARHWLRDTGSDAACEQPIAPNRERLGKILGVVDERPPPGLRVVATAPPEGDRGAILARTESYTVRAVRWDVLSGVEAEGLLLTPDGEAAADVVALPDCDCTPEALCGLAPGVPMPAQFARRLAENRCRVLVPVLISREATHSGIPGIRMTNQPHREFIYRAAFELGRHIIGYEVQKVLAAVDWFGQDEARGDRPIGVVGYGEGGLLGFCAAALDTRIRAGLISGYFAPREDVWAEPIYRNVFGLLEQFGDAEIASMIAPRALVVEAAAHPAVDGPPPPTPDRAGAAPGRLATPPLTAVGSEIERAAGLLADLAVPPPFVLVASGEGAGPPGTDAALAEFLTALGAPGDLIAPGPAPVSVSPPVDADERQRRQFQQLVGHTQDLLQEAEFRRQELWAEADDTDIETWAASCAHYRTMLWDDVIGRLPPATVPPSPRTRLTYDEPGFLGFEVLLDVYDDVFAYGLLLLPKDLREGERRPVVVCQHGLEGTCQKVVEYNAEDQAYHRFAARLVERGFVVYAPQNPYIGGDRFRVLQRKLNPLGKSLFSVIVRQHEATLEWLGSLPFVDRGRIGLYGISYGGKTAMRVPALLESYCLSICSADFDEWIWKNASARHRYSYLATPEYEMFEFNLGNTFNYAERSWLIFPRPFMVERGHHDGVAPDEWVFYEYARTFRRYDLFGLRDRTEMEVFDGPHTIHGQGTFEFLHKHLQWPAPEEGR